MTMSSVCVKCSQSTVTTSDFDDTLLELNNLSCLNIASLASNIPHLSDLDIDLNMPGPRRTGSFN